MKNSIQYAVLIFISMAFTMPPAASQTKDNKAIIPPARLPAPPDSKKCAERKAEDENDEEDEKRQDTFKYGITTEVGQLLDKLTKNDDPRYVDEAYNLFQKTPSSEVKEKTLEYFAKFNDPCLADFACKTLNEYYDEKTTLVNAALRYTGDVKCQEALPAITNIITDGDERFWQAAMTAIGKAGGDDEAVFLTELFQNEAEEMTVSKKQSLVRALGEIHALDTWDALVDMAENEDENTFVRMYAAQAIGNMGLAESIPVLQGLYAASDPNLREYAIKGLANFKGNKDGAQTIIEAIKDAHPKVRIEAINDAAQLNITDASPAIVFRAKNDGESSVKKAAFDALALLGTNDGEKFLLDLLSDKKAGDGAKRQAAESLLKAGDRGDSAIADAALAALYDNTKKPLRRALASVIAKHSKSAFAPVCKAYLLSKDSDSVSLGLDMYGRGKYPAAAEDVREIAESKGSNKNRAKKMLGDSE